MCFDVTVQKESSHLHCSFTTSHLVVTCNQFSEDFSACCSSLLFFARTCLCMHFIKKKIVYKQPHHWIKNLIDYYSRYSTRPRAKLHKHNKRILLARFGWSIKCRIAGDSWYFALVYATANIMGAQCCVLGYIWNQRFKWVYTDY
jgi:hypothetical protein